MSYYAIFTKICFCLNRLYRIFCPFTFQEKDMSTKNLPILNETVVFTVTTKALNGSTVYQAVANLGPGFGPASVRRVDGSINFPNRRAIVKAINRRAEALNLTPTIRYTRTTSLPTTTKRAALRTGKAASR